VESKTEYGFGWDEIDEDLIKNKEYEFYMKFIGLEEIN
jgi:hypothetical protein